MKLIITFALCFAMAMVQGQGTRDSDLMEDKTYQSSVGSVDYLLFVPENYDENRRYPLVVSLRGSGSTYISATDGFEMAHPWIEDSIQAREPHFIMVPECIAGTWGGLAGAPSNGVMATASKAVMETIEELKRQYSLDTNRFILTGFSLGGSGTYHILELTPNYWAAGIPTSAGGDSSQIESIAQTSIWHHQGSNDGSAGRRMTAALENHGYEVVRMVCDFTIDSPSKWRDAIQGGDSPEDIIFKNARAPVTVDSLRRAIDAGARYIYSELNGGNHSSGWMNAAHNPLLAKWAFSQRRGGVTSIKLDPEKTRELAKRGNAILTLGIPSGLLNGSVYSLQGRRLRKTRGETQKSPQVLLIHFPSEKDGELK